MDEKRAPDGLPHGDILHTAFRRERGLSHALQVVVPTAFRHYRVAEGVARAVVTKSGNASGMACFENVLPRF